MTMVKAAGDVAMMTVLTLYLVSPWACSEQQPWPGFSRHNPRIQVENVLINNYGHSGLWKLVPTPMPHPALQGNFTLLNTSRSTKLFSPASRPASFSAPTPAPPSGSLQPTSHADLTVAAQTYVPAGNAHVYKPLDQSPFPTVASATPSPYSVYHDYSHATTGPPLPTVAPTEAITGSRPTLYSTLLTDNQEVSISSTTPQPSFLQTPPHQDGQAGNFNFGPPPQNPYQQETQTINTEVNPKESSAPNDIQYQLQLQVSQQIQVQLEQLQKLQELQHKMLNTPKTILPESAMQNAQGSEDVRQYAIQHTVHQEQSVMPKVQQTSQDPLTNSPTLSPLPLEPYPSSSARDFPRYPEESQSLQSFIRGEGSSSIPKSESGFLPIPQPIEPPSGSMFKNETDFLPFVEMATDPALPYYLVPPAIGSDSQYSHHPRLSEGQELDGHASFQMVPPLPVTGDNFDLVGNIPSGSAPQPGVSGPPVSSGSSSGPTGPYRRHLRNVLSSKGRFRPPRHR